MKYLVLLVPLICSIVIVQVYTWNIAYPKTSVKLGFSRRPERSLYGSAGVNRQRQTYLTPASGIQRPQVRQRNIRDLMTRFVVNNQRTSMSPPSFNRQTAQRMIVRPATGVRTRGTNFHPTYHEAFALPSGSVLHSLNENPRAQTMVMRERDLRKINVPPAQAHQADFQRASLRAPTFQKPQVLKEIHSMSAPPKMYRPNQRNTALLDSAAMKDILSSSSDSRLQSQKSPKRVVEVIHHIPMSMNQPKLKTGNSAVVYISKPKHGAQASQGMVMRNLPQNSMLATGQGKLMQSSSFVMRDQDSVLSAGNNFKQGVTAQKNRFQNHHFVPSNSESFHQQHRHVPYLVPSTESKGKFFKDGLKDNRNTEFRGVLKSMPQPHVLRPVTPNVNTKQGIPGSLTMPVRTTQTKNPRINRLRQELNAEIEQLLKLVPQSSLPATKKPKLMIQQQIPHPFLIPSPQTAGNVGTKQMKTPLSPEVLRNIPRNQKLPASNSKFEIQQPHMVSVNTKEDFLKAHSLKEMKMPKIPDMLSLNHRRPVVSESTVDSEELAEILESIGYPGKNKLIHNMAGREPVKLIIPDQSKEIKHIVNSSSISDNLSFHSNGDMHPPETESVSPYNIEDLSPSQTENLSPHMSEDLRPSKSENLSPDYSEGMHPTETENLTSHISEDMNPFKIENLSPYNSEDMHQFQTEGLSPHFTEYIYPLKTENASTYESENVHYSDTEDLSSPKTEDLPPSDSEDNIHFSNTESTNEGLNESDLNFSNNDQEHSNKSSIAKTYWDFRKENGGLQTTTVQTLETDSFKLDTEEKETPFSHNVNNYQGQESVASISVKEEFPMEEEIKGKYRQKQESFKHNSGTLHDVYNKKIYDENTERIPSSHFARYYPQHMFQGDAENSPTLGSESKIILPVTTSKAYEHGEFIKSMEAPNLSLAKAAYFDKRPQENSTNTFSLSNMRENPPSQRSTEIPKYLATNKNTNISLLHRSNPRYVITKTPYRQPYYTYRNRSKNENSLIPKYIVPERQQLENHRMNITEYLASEAISQRPSNPRFQNFGLRQFTTEATTFTQSSFNSDKYKSHNMETIKDSRWKYVDTTSVSTTTDVPQVTTYSNFEVETAESQVENTQEFEENGNEFDIPEKPEMAVNRQFFRGPQHSIMYDELTTDSFQEPTTDFIDSISSETTIAPTMAIASVSEANPFTQYNEPGVRQYSVHSQTKVINALHLANKVFGRRNHTSFKQTVSTTKMPLSRHKFTYAPVIKSTTKHSTAQPESTTTNRRLVFNFRTGTTHSMPTRASSAVPKIVFTPVTRSKLTPKSRNDTLDFIPEIKEEDKVISSSSPRNVFQHIVFAQPNITSKSTHIQSVVTETSKNLYGVLKPITKSYNSSTTSSNETEVKKTTAKSFKVQIIPTTIKPTNPVSTSTSTDNIRYSTTLTSMGSLSTSTNLPNTTTSMKNAILVKETTSVEITETTMPVTNPSTTEVQTEATSVKGLKTAINLQVNTTISPTPTETTTEAVNQEQIFVDSLKSMKLKMQDMASKGLRHLMPLVMELSSDVSISSDCTFSLLRWLRAVRTMEQWAVRMMDASSKIPEGILYGTFSTFGSYDECVAIKTPKFNLQMPYTGQYCSINIQPILPPSERHFTIQNAFRKYPKLKQVFQEMNIDEDTMAYYYILKHRIGLCMPSTCSIEDLGNVTEKLADDLKMKITVERCETSEKPSFTRGQIISMCGVFITFGIVILATIIDLSMRVRSDHEMDIDEIIRKKNGIRQFSYVFSAFGNARKILDTSIPATHLSSLHGIKFLSITWVMLGHVYYCKDYLTLAGLNKVRDLGSNLAFQVVLNSAYGADTFFFLSGLLVVYSTFLYLENNNGHFTIVGFYIRRYWRLTPAFLMISGVILLGPLAGSGPIWHETLEPFVSGCQNYWWTNLFYFSNFMPTDKTCVPHGWFLSCDMQFYIVAPIIILALYRRPKLGILLIILGILSSMITTGFLTFLYNLPPVSLFSLPDPKDINEYLDTVGYKPYAHYASYCIGMATGFLLAAKQKISISKCLQAFGWVASAIGCLLVIYGTWNWNSGELPDWTVSVAYATTSRTVWCLGVAWLTIVCYAGHGGHINTILSWHGFIPLSRLSYLAYLIHPLLMYLYASYVRSPFYFSQYVVVYLYLGHLCVTFGLAFLFSLAFEVPFLNLEKVITKYLDKSKRKRRASFSNHHNNWQHPEHPELKDSVVLMRRRADKFLT